MRKATLLGLAWMLLPRRLKLVLVGIAGVSLVLAAGAVAVLIFVLYQLT